MKKFISILTALTFAAALTVGSSAALLGDVNKDGKVNSMDALSILRYSVGLAVGDFKSFLADINGDGAVNSADALTALRISVGIEESKNVDTLLYDQEEMLDFYNKAIDRTYEKTKKLRCTLEDECDIYIDNEGEHFNEGPEEYEIDFVDGKDEEGYTPYAYAPASSLDLMMVSDIKFQKNGDGYIAEVYIKPETVDNFIMDKLYYQYAGGMPIIYQNGDEFEYVFCLTSYPGTYVKAEIDKDGYVTSFYVDVPYSTNSYIEYYVDGECCHNEIKEEGRRQHHIYIETV